MKLSFDKIRGLLQTALNPKGGYTDVWLEEVFEDEAVYNKSGKLYKVPYQVKDGEVTLGAEVEVERETEYVPVFSVERLFTAFKETRDDGIVVRRGKLFEAGDYPDKKVSFDEADLDLAASSFSPVSNDLEHVSSILDGKLGRLAKVWKKGAELFGEVELPKWLDETIGEEPIKVSLAFDRHKKIVGNALVLRPRIEDAAILSAFSSSTPSLLPKGNPPGDKPSMKLKEAIKHLFGLDKVDDLDVEVTLPANSAPTPEPTPAEDAVPTPAPAPETPADEPTPTFSKEVEARFAAMETELLNERSLAFADEIIRSKKAFPAQREQVSTMFKQAVRADAGQGSVFSSEKNSLVEGAQVNALKSFFAAAPTHSLAGEAFVDDAAVLLFGNKGGVALAEDKKSKLLAMSSLGQKAVEVASKK